MSVVFEWSCQMRGMDPLSAMSKALQNALMRDLPGKKVESRIGPPLILRPTESEVEIIHFRQIWNTTSLGFSTPGKYAVTPGYTTVVTDRVNFAVYFNGRLAYTLSKPSQEFFDDLNRRVLRPVKNVKYYEAREAAHA